MQKRLGLFRKQVKDGLSGMKALPPSLQAVPASAPGFLCILQRISLHRRRVLDT